MDNFFAVLIVAVSFGGGVTVLTKLAITWFRYRKYMYDAQMRVELVEIAESRKISSSYTKLAPPAPQSGLYRPYSWMDEEKVMVEREFRCPYCEVEARTKPALYQHIEICHPGKRKRVTKPKK